MPSIINQTADSFELQNIDPAKKNDDEPPTLLAEMGTWRAPAGDQSGVSITVYGELSPLLSVSDARKLAKWLLRAADELEGDTNKHSDRRGQKKRREFEDDE